MPKNTAQRRIDSRRQNRATTINGVTLSGSPGSGGSAALAGDGLSYDGVALNVGAGTLLTVGADTVGITAGSTYQFVGTGSGTAAAYQNLSTLAGAGLTHSAGVLAVGAGNGITVNADDVALTTPGTLTASTSNSASGNHTHAVTTGAASTLTVATTNATGSSASLARADHLHTITTSSNPGAAAAILASTASGGLTLQSLAVQGSVDITNNGDLTVAGSGAYAGSSVLFVDSSGGNVGIMGAPDPQFALDVVGPCRATWFVGPHAIQLKDVLLLAHFDGRQPFESNFTGEKNGHMGQVATAIGGVIHRPGMFGTKALQIAEATTNLCTNPSFETGTTGWTYQDSNASGSAARTQAYVHSGSYSVRLVNTNGGEDDYYWFNVTGLSASTAYTITAMANVVSFTAGATSNRGLYCYDTADAGGTAQGTTITDVSDGWARHSVTVTTTAAGGSHTIQIRLYAPQGYIAWDSVQVEAKAYATPYCDGSLGDGHSWSGTAHASTSSRTAAALSYPTSGNVNVLKGTVMAWVWLHDVGGTYDVLRITGSTAGLILLRVAAGGLVGYWGTAAISSGGTVQAHTWHHLAMTYSGTTLTTYLDGVQVSTGSSSGFNGLPATMGVGSVAGGGNYINGWIDDFVITESAIDADGIRAVYESDAPVFAESSRFSFRATPQGLVWADDEGLWMRNSTGGTVLGAYGSDATKSWAGLTLAPSDVVIGDSARGAYMLWDDSAGTLTVGKTGASNSYLNITGADIAIYQNSVARIVANGSGSLTLRDTAGTAQLTLSGSGTILVGETGASKSNVYIASGAISMRVNTTERIGLSSAGVLTIKDSGGAAVFTLDASAGAEFTKPLTIGTSGGIYQGTGSFASPTTGLKIWNDGGVGRMAGYNSSAVQWTIGTDGKFYSADSDGNTIRIDSGGMRVRMTSGSESFPGVIWCRPLDTSDVFANYFGWMFGTYNTSTKVARQYVRSYVNTDTDSSYEARTIVEAMGRISGSTSGASMEVVRNRTSYYINMNAYQVNFSGYTQHGTLATPSGTPPAGYLLVWFNSSGSNYTLNVKDSSGSVKSVTLS